jgi:molecular chaperone DnaK
VVRAYFEELLGRKAELGIDPMECVASGAAIEAGVLAGEVRDIVLVDVTPLTLGVETLGGVATSIVGRNTPIPIKRSESFTTAADMQTSVTIHVYQGERPMAADNVSLGQFNLDGLVPAPRGMPKIDVTFDIDASGILNVTARDAATGKSQSIRITGSTRLSDKEKTRMVEEAARYAEEDRKRREQAEQLNNADALCYEAERVLAEHGEKLPADLRGGIETATKETREAWTKKDAASAAERSEKLRAVLREAGTTIYAQAPKSAEAWQGSGARDETGPTTTAQPGTEIPHARVVDAEYRETK